jgi:nicotinamide-nucleotide adenylyltransferase
MIGVYWGRFNPPHKGHLKLIKRILQEVDSLIVVIGSSQEKNTKRNPFSGKERKEMMEAYLKEMKVNMNRVKVISIEDKTSHASSLRELISGCGKFDVIYIDNASLIKAVGNKFIVRKIKRIGLISATRIRDAIAEDKKWEHLTGKSVVRLIKKFKGIERIKKAYNSY